MLFFNVDTKWVIWDFDTKIQEESWSWNKKVLPWSWSWELWRSWSWDPESWSWSWQQSLIYIAGYLPVDSAIMSAVRVITVNLLYKLLTYLLFSWWSTSVICIVVYMLVLLNHTLPIVILFYFHVKWAMTPRSFDYNCLSYPAECVGRDFWMLLVHIVL